MVAGSSVTTLTQIRSACRTVDARGREQTHCDFCFKRKILHKYDKWIVGSSYIGGSYSSCSVQIRVVKLSDAGDYHFRFETDQPLGRWTSPNTITLDVTGGFIQRKPAATSPLWWRSLESCGELMQPLLFVHCVRLCVCFRPPGPGASGKTCQHVWLWRDCVCGMPGQRMCCSRKEPCIV